MGGGEGKMGSIQHLGLKKKKKNQVIELPCFVGEKRKKKSSTNGAEQTQTPPPPVLGQEKTS